MTLVISDTHLGKYNRKKDIFLQNLISKFDSIIINGDLYDNWIVNAQEFVNSEYRYLLQLLKNKHTVRVYGNHDPYENNSYLQSVFKYQGKQFEIQIGKERYHFTPGHELVKEMKSRYLEYWYKFVDVIPNFFKRILYRLEIFAYTIAPQKAGYNKIGLKRNEFIMQNKPENVYYVTGDTHVPAIDKKKKYINSGCIIGRLVSYIVINDSGDPELITKIIN